MKKILTITFLAITTVLASCSKKTEIKSTYLNAYNSIFSPKNILGTAD